MSGTLVVVAHPDDETFGCGGTIAKWGDCAVVVLTDGVSSRGVSETAAKERHDAFIQAMRILGVKSTSYHGLPDDQRLDSGDFLDLTNMVAAAIAWHTPDRILTHHLGDLNKDHRLTAEAVLIACRPPNRCEILSFETPSSTEWAYGMEPAFRPNVFVNLDLEARGRKGRAMAAYSAEMRPYPHPRSAQAIESRLEYWGQMAGCEYAEPFMLLRGYR